MGNGRTREAEMKFLIIVVAVVAAVDIVSASWLGLAQDPWPPTDILDMTAPKGGEDVVHGHQLQVAKEMAVQLHKSRQRTAVLSELLVLNFGAMIFVIYRVDKLFAGLPQTGKAGAVGEHAPEQTKGDGSTEQSGKD